MRDSKELDRALLQSLIEQRNDLCVLRTAFASTTGFYLTVEKTVLTRLTFVVDMNTPLGSEGQGIDLARFAARYMNALRQGEVKLRNDLQNWSGGEGVFDVSNRCEACDNIKVCHATFGEADGFGLYPFTRQALDQMADRADPEAHQKFNPRRFQKSVLRPVAFAAPESEAGRFPPPELLTSLGGVQKLGPAEQNRLRNVDPVNFERRRALLELWDGDGQVKNLPANLQTAFGLDMLRLETQPTPPSRPKPDTPPGPDIPRPPPTPTPSDARPSAPAPSSVAVGEGSVWVLDGDDKTVTQIDPETNDVRRVFSTSSRPTDIAAGAGAVWVGNGPSRGLSDFPESVSRIDPASGVVVGTVDLPPAARGPSHRHRRLQPAEARGDAGSGLGHQSRTRRSRGSTRERTASSRGSTRRPS